MEGRSSELYLELTDVPVEDYGAERLRDVLNRRDVSTATLWHNQRPMRDDFPRTIPEFRTLAIYEVEDDFELPTDAEGHRGQYFRRVPRPAQGVSGSGPTLGVEVVLVSPVTAGGA